MISIKILLWSLLKLINNWYNRVFKKKKKVIYILVPIGDDGNENKTLSPYLVNDVILEHLISESTIFFTLSFLNGRLLSIEKI